MSISIGNVPSLTVGLEKSFHVLVAAKLDFEETRGARCAFIGIWFLHLK
jgi:hypothetical protein